MAELTPMMRQYMEIKEQNPDSILFFRLGDFYEMFGPDARTASRELDLALTTRDKDKNKSFDEKIPMCGIPYHASDAYIARLIAKGYKVAICEQTEDPAAAKGLVKRDIIRVVTPGTVIDESCLSAERSNYLCGVYLDDTGAGLCACDVSTGKAQATVFTGPDRVRALLNELGRFAPAEAVMNEAAYFDETLHRTMQERFSCHMEKLSAARFTPEDAEKKVRTQFGQEALERLPRDNMTPLLALGGLLGYLYETQKTDLGHLDQLTWYRTGQYMELDLTARRNLELTETMRSGEKRGSLLWVLDKTKTAMGSRMLRSWLEKPLLSPKRIERRLGAVEELTQDTVVREELGELLREVSDLERVMARVVTGTANARDLVSFASGCRTLPALHDMAAARKAALFGVLAGELDGLADLRELVERAIADEPPFTLREGGIIRAGYNAELDRLRDIVSGGTGTLTRIEAEEKEKTGIRNLRVGYNRVFGYYIEVAKGQVSMVPEHYIRKQTLANGERYITPELKELESEILTAKDRISALEYELFTEVRMKLAEQAERVQRTAHAAACLDVLTNFASVAVKNNYCRPEIDLSGEINIKDGRHPVVERVLKDALFVPNDTHLNGEADRVAILTGPNMAGKSTYMRQVALIVLMAQMGSFVPAKSARIGVIDRIFTRIGASDDLASGKSTFMVEMAEVAEILKNATPRSLLILDEIGRGTSTFDGMAIARAVLEYAADPKRLGAKTLFATHYHELTDIEQELPGVRNYNIAVKKRGGDIVFLRKIVPGAADDSYGVEVAKLAGLPDRVVSRARELLKDLESGAPVRTVTVAAPDQFSITSMENDALRRKLESIAVETLTPIEAMNALYELKQML